MMNIIWTYHLLHLADPGHHHVLAGHAAHPGQLQPVLLTNERKSLRGGGGHASPQRLSDIVGQVPIPFVLMPSLRTICLLNYLAQRTAISSDRSS